MFDRIIKNNYTYRPLHGKFEIKESPIEGVGLFLKEDSLSFRFSMDYITHYCISQGDLGDILIRTPLGGFINHSDDPNCELEVYSASFGSIYVLRPLREVRSGEEITLHYEQTKICKNA